MELANKPAGQLTASELKELLADTMQKEAQQQLKKRQSYEQLKFGTVDKLVDNALGYYDVLEQFKALVFGELGTIYKLLQEYSSRHEDGKGNFTIENEGKTKKIVFKREETTRFDERATMAEKHILDFITAEFSNNDPKSKIIRKLLERKKDQLDKDQVLLLLSMRDDFDNENWRKGLDLLKESIVPAETRYYVQFYHRQNEAEKWQSIILNFSKINTQLVA